jgi:hypothetical protein
MMLIERRWLLAKYVIGGLQPCNLGSYGRLTMLRLEVPQLERSIVQQIAFV